MKKRIIEVEKHGKKGVVLGYTCGKNKVAVKAFGWEVRCKGFRRPIDYLRWAGLLWLLQ